MGLAQDRLSVFLTTFEQVRTNLSARLLDPPREQLFNHLVYKQIIDQVDNICLMIETELRAKEANIKEIKYEDYKIEASPRIIIPVEIKPIAIDPAPVEEVKV